MNTTWLEWLRNPPKKYRPQPFWSWNDKLDIEKTRNQIALMDEAGLGGYFMHARGGLETPYMEKEWMQNIRAGIQEGQAREMNAWGYDENGWPSGFSDGKVNGLGEEYQQKYLRWERVENAVQTERTIACVPYEGRLLHFYYDVNPYYVDLLNPQVTRAFLDCTHERYAKELGENLDGLTGFFTDEPQLSRCGFPWSHCLPEAYQEAYGESLESVLPALFFETDNWAQTRVRFWRLVRNRFVDSFMKQLQEWCHAHGAQLTGHMLLEESLSSQLTCNSACMPSYAYMDMPGMDCLCRYPTAPAAPLQVSSVAHQLGKKQIISETFAACGWDVSFEDMRWICEHQMVRGVTTLCPHLEAYSLRGIRKRDYPASLFYQQPWWDEYRRFNDLVSRIGMLLSEGQVAFDVLVLHAQPSAWVLYDAGECKDLGSTEQAFAHVLDILDTAQIPYHLGDEWVLEKHARVANGRLCVGSQQYSVVVVPPSVEMGSSTLSLLEEFVAAGGQVIWSDRLPERVDGILNAKPAELAAQGVICQVDDIPSAMPQTIQRVHITEETGNTQSIASTVRLFDDTRMVYLVNSSNDTREITLQLQGTHAARMQESDGTLVALPVRVKDGVSTVSIRLEKHGSAVIFDALAPLTQTQPSSTILRPLPLNADWNISAMDDNVLTLDVCACSFDGESIGDAVPITDIQELACERKQAVNVEMVFRFQVEQMPAAPLQLVSETPWNYQMTLNGQPVDTTPIGWWRDETFQRLRLPCVQVGENELRITTRFEQQPETYEKLKRSLCFESEKNKLTYDQEIEPFYLLGKFGVRPTSDFERVGQHSLRCKGGFCITDQPQTVKQGNLVEQGLPFFAGGLTLSQTLTLTEEETKKRCLSFTRLGAIVTAVRVNNKPAGEIVWSPYTVSLDGLLQEGENHIEITLKTSLRNALGPHHMATIESVCVTPSNFFHHSPLWCGGTWYDWHDGYTFADVGIFVE